jgi:uncharacterized protein YecE (DUF72 family)
MASRDELPRLLDQPFVLDGVIVELLQDGFDLRRLRIVQAEAEAVPPFPENCVTFGGARKVPSLGRAGGLTFAPPARKIWVAMSKRRGTILVGTSGFNYPHWGGGVFYPEGLPERRWLEFYAERFPTVELNVTFYRLPAPASFEGWRARTPEGFSFMIKGSRYITHIKRLKGVAMPLRRFFDSARRLEEKLAGVLWQLPPSLHADDGLLGKFLDGLRRYDVRHAFEFRHASWWSQGVFDLIRAHGAAFVEADLVEAAGPDPLGFGFPFYYVRRHGSGGRYAGDYPHAELKALAGRLVRIAEGGRDAFVYFNNDAQGFAVKNAMELAEMAGGRILLSSK